MGLVPRIAYPYIYGQVTCFGPFDAADFVALESIASLSTSGSTNTSYSTNITSSISSEVGLAAETMTMWCPDKDMFIDEVWMRARVLSSDNMNRLRLLSVSNGQTVENAWKNRQFITSRNYGNIGDETLSSAGADDSLPSSGASESWNDPMTLDLKRDLRVIPNQNKVPAGGLLVILAEEAPDALVDLIIGVRWRETIQ